MLNYNKIHSSINYDRTSKRSLASYIGIPPSTLRSRLEGENLTPNDVEKIAEYFKKPIAYYFDKEESNIVNEPEIKVYRCPECIEKQKTIDILKEKLAEITEKYTAVLEELLGKKGRNSANSA